MRLCFYHGALLLLPVGVALLGLWTGPLQGQQPDRAWAKAKVFTNSIGMKLVLIPGGTFTMGAPEYERERQEEEREHKVTLTKSFHMGAYEVTQGQFVQVMGDNPSCYKKGKNLPVENVTWLEAKGFCDQLSAWPLEKKAGRVYRLPTEAQWEYACRAGTTTKYHFGGVITIQKACFGVPRGVYGPAPVGSFQPNPWGLYDMHGNVTEWCADSYGKGYYSQSPEMDPQGPPDQGHVGDQMVIRGGSWQTKEPRCRSATRFFSYRNRRDPDIGFRVICVLAARDSN